MGSALGILVLLIFGAIPIVVTGIKLCQTSAHRALNWRWFVAISSLSLCYYYFNIFLVFFRPPWVSLLPDRFNYDVLWIALWIGLAIATGLSARQRCSGRLLAVSDGFVCVLLADMVARSLPWSVYSGP